MHTHHHFLFALLLPTLCGSALASDDELLFDVPVVLSASRLYQPASNAPLAVSTIDRQVIEASGARNIPELLRIVPGMVVARSANEFGDEPEYVVSYHGHSDQFSRRMQVLIDGRSIYEPTLGGVRWKTIPINVDDIERIEVIRGPNASSFGANSFLAVVNIITRHAAEDKGHLFVTRLGNHDIQDITYRYADSHEDDIDYRITITGQQDDGQDREDGLPNNDGIEARVLDYRVDFQIDESNSLTWQGGYGRTDQQADINNATLGTKPARVSENSTGHQFFKWENTSSDEDTYIIQYYVNYFDRTDESISRTFDPAQIGISADPFNLDLNYNITSFRHNLEFTHDNNSIKDTRLIWGLSAQLDEIESFYYLGPGVEVDRRTDRAFVNVEHRLQDSHILQVGTLYEENEFGGDRLSPRFSYTYQPSSRHSFRYSISRAIRQPFIFESDANAFFSQDLTAGGTPTGITLFYQEVLATPGLRTESILSRDIGYYGSLIDHSLNLNVRLFNDDISDLIFTQSIDASGITPHNLPISTATFRNRYDSNIRGLEAELDLKIGNDSRVIASTALFDIDAARTLIVESAPKQSASLMTIFGFDDGYIFSATAHYVSNMAFTDVNNATPDGDVTGDYTALDLRISKTFRYNSSDITVALTGQDLLNDYNAYDAAPSNGPLLVNNSKWYLEFRVNHH